MKIKSTVSYIIINLVILWVTSYKYMALAQAPPSKQYILVDVAHGQKFWNDPANMVGKDSSLVQRINYMNGELLKNAAALNAEVNYLKVKITPDVLAKCDLLFIHIPSSKYDADEIKALQQYVSKGGSLFLAMDANYHSTLEQTNVNDILTAFNIQFAGESPVTQSGGHTKEGVITKNALSIPYHGARIVNGGTPFCFNDQTQEHPFGTFMKVKNGGKIIAMGDGMVSLYMTSWNGVNGYQCSEFMHDTLAWLLK